MTAEPLPRWRPYRVLYAVEQAKYSDWWPVEIFRSRERAEQCIARNIGTFRIIEL